MFVGNLYNAFYNIPCMDVVASLAYMVTDLGTEVQF